MKNKVLSIIVFALAFTSCQKSNKKTLPADQNSFVFGYENAICATCGSIHPSSMAFLLKGGNTYPLKDSLIHFESISNLGDSTNFQVISLGGNSSQLSTALESNFPSFMLNSSDSIYGLPSPYFGYLVFSIKNNGVERRWSVNWDTTAIPVEIRPYVAQVISTIDSLYPTFNGIAHPHY